MFKVVFCAKRKAGSTREEFREYMDKHRRIGEDIITGFGTRYFCHFVLPLQPDDPESPHDCLTEVWFPDRKAYDACMAKLYGDKEMVAYMQADEAKFVERSSLAAYIIEDGEWALGPLDPAFQRP